MPLQFSIPDFASLGSFGDLSFDGTVTPFEGKTLPGESAGSKEFEPYDFDDGEKEDSEKSDLKYFERTGDFTVSLKFKEVFEGLLDAVGTHLPVDFVKRFQEATESGATAATIPLKFKFDFTLPFGQSNFPISTPEFDLGYYFENVRQHEFVLVMRALFLVLVCLYFVFEMFQLVFQI